MNRSRNNYKKLVEAKKREDGEIQKAKKKASIQSYKRPQQSRFNK